MNIITPSISRREFQVLAALSDRRKTLFTVQDARDAVDLHPVHLYHLLQGLVRKRILERLARGLYLLIPIEAGSQRLHSEDALVVASALTSPAAVAYWSALNFHQFTEQIPDVVFVETTRQVLRREREVLGMRFRFIRVAEHKFFGVETVQTGDKPVRVTDREKTLLDALDHPEYCGGMIESAKALVTGWKECVPAKVLDYAVRMNNSAVFKRLGFLLEHYGLADSPYLERIRKRLRPGYSKLEPLNSLRGPHCARWLIRINLSLQDLIQRSAS